MIVTDEKDPEEVVDVSFDFSRDLADGETVSAGTAQVAIEVLSGEDAAVADMLQGGPQLQGNVVVQRVRNGVDGVDYGLRCRVDTSAGQRLVLPMTLPVREA